MSAIIDQLTDLLQLRKLDSNPSLSFIERKANVKPSAVVIAILVFLLIVTLISNATSIVVAIGCCVVPAYFTFIVIEGREWESIKKHLVYWIIYALLEVFAPFFAYLLSSILYVLLRIGITVALIHPESSLGLHLYDGFIGPFLE
jgi:hypothetical protein